MKTTTNDKNYVNIFRREQAEPVYCYRSGLTVYEERFLDGGSAAVCADVGLDPGDTE